MIENISSQDREKHFQQHQHSFFPRALPAKWQQNGTSAQIEEFCVFMLLCLSYLVDTLEFNYVHCNTTYKL